MRYDPAVSSCTAEQHIIMLSCNTAWNVYSRKRLLTSLGNSGWKVITLAAEDDCAVSIRTELSLPFIPLPMKSDSTNIVQDGRLLLRYVSLYRKYKPAAVLHINNKPNIYGTLAASILGIPSISNITGLGIVAEKKGIMKHLVYFLYRIAFSSRRAHVLFQNNEDRSFFLDNKLVTSEKTGVIPGSGVDTDRFCPDFSVPPPEQSAHFLYVGRLLLSKGIEDFIRAAEKVKYLYPECSFTIIGEHDPLNDIYISRESLDMALSGGFVNYKGNVRSVRDELVKADCVVLPSRYREGVPRALLEAAAMGKPLIAADSVGTREPVEDGVNGFLVPPSDPDQLAASMIAFVRLSSDNKRSMGVESRRIAMERFSDSIVIQAYHDLLDAITENHTTRIAHDH